MPRQFYLAAYDISHPRRQGKARERIRAYALGGQKSVFECLLTPAETAQLLRAMEAVLDGETDSFLLLRLDPRATIEVLGLGRAPELGAFFYQA